MPGIYVVASRIPPQTVNTEPFALGTEIPYDGYPIEQMVIGGVRLWLEGRIYHDELAKRSKVHQLLAAIERKDIASVAIAVKAFQEMPGEYVAIAISGNQIYCFNDSLGRLPFYWSCRSELFFAGRILNPLFERVKKKPDPTGILQYLWCGYPLSSHTLYHQVNSLAPGALLHFDADTFSANLKTTTPLNLSARRNLPAEKLAGELAHHFCQATRQMTGPFGQVHLSLSGGQDSRAVAAALVKAQLPVSASSYCHSPSDKDAALAKSIAAQLRIPWKSFALPKQALEQDADWLIAHKAGLNYTGMAFIIPYLQWIKTQLPHGGTLLTGDGGDKALPYLGEKKPIGSLDELVKMLMRRHSMGAITEVLRLCGASAADLHQSIYETVKDFPEDSLNDKAIHFVITERGRKAYFEGEDRNRYFAWSSSPFYHQHFFQEAMQVPDAFKKNYRFYFAFMKALMPQLSEIADAGGGRLGRPDFHFRKWIQESFRSSAPLLKSSLRKLDSWRNPNPALEQKMITPEAGLNFLPNGGNEIKAFLQNASTDHRQYLLTLMKSFAS